MQKGQKLGFGKPDSCSLWQRGGGELTQPIPRRNLHFYRVEKIRLLTPDQLLEGTHLDEAHLTFLQVPERSP